MTRCLSLSLAFLTIAPAALAQAPVPTEPVPTEPVPTEPVPTEPVPTEPVPTEPAPPKPEPNPPAPPAKSPSDPIPTSPAAPAAPTQLPTTRASAVAAEPDSVHGGAKGTGPAERTESSATSSVATDTDATSEPVIDPAPVPIAQGYAPPPPPLTLDQDASTIRLMPSGSLFTRYELRENYEELGVSRGRFLEGDAIAARMRFGLRTSDIDLGNGGRVSVQFTPQASGFWGLMPQQLADAELGLHEGFVHYVPGSAFALDIGRLALNYGDALVIGNVDWHETGRSFDGARGRFTIADGAWLDLIFTQLAEGRGSTDTDIGAADQYFGGVYASIGQAIGIGAELDPYLLFNLAPATDVSTEDGQLVPRDSALQGTLGLRLKGAASIVDYRAEAGLQFGSRVAAPEDSVLAYQADVEVGVKVPSANLRLAVEGFYATGDDPTTEDNEAWDQLFPTGHKWLGLMDVIPTRSNIAGGVFHVSYAGLQPVTLVGQAHVFASTADVPLAADEVLQAGYRGSELDLGVVVALGGNLKLRTLYGVFLPASEGWADDRAAHFSETELRLDF